MLAQLQRVEVEAFVAPDHELTVEHATVRELRQHRLAQLGEVAQQRLRIAALQVQLVAVAEHDATEAVPLRFVQQFAFGRQLTRELREHRVDGRRDRQRHRAPTTDATTSSSATSVRSPVARSLRSTTPRPRPFAPTTSCTGTPMRSASANFTPGLASRSS